MKFDLSSIEALNEIISSNNCFQKEKKSIEKNKKSKGYTYQYYNQLCTCIIRIRETSQYLEKFSFRRENDFGQAFDFYEFINCVSIIEGCIEVLFKIFGLDLKKHYPIKKAFKISNRTRNSDIAFFKFIRSAASMHPAETTSHNKITKHKFEVYPYAIWCNSIVDIFNEKKPKDADIELLSWNCKTNGNYKRYYLVINEFYGFINNLLESVSNIIPYAEDIVANYKEKIRCKRLKKIADFTNWSEYCLYLRKIIHSKLTDEEYPDGGLLLASHIFSNKLIGNEFKEYIKEQIRNITEKMMSDIELIDYDEIFNDLHLISILEGSDSNYISEKYHDCLYKEILYEIEKNDYKQFEQNIRYEENNCNYSNEEWCVILLLNSKNRIILEAIKKAITYCDLYELVLETIYKNQSE